MKKAIAGLAALAALGAIPATASAQTMHCRDSYGDAVVMNIVAHKTSCEVAVGVVEDQWMTPGPWDWYNARYGGGPWRVTRRWNYSQAMPVAYVRATRGRSWITWIAGT
jgi:hypothetical protein